MKKLNKSLIILSLAATAFCGLTSASFAPTVSVEAGDNAPSTTYAVTTPEEYYKNFDDSGSGDEFLSKLRTFNMDNRKSNYNYGSLNSIYKYTDYDPATIQYDSKGQPYGTSLLSFYSGKSTTSYNKEHVWPNSRGGGSKKGKSGSPYVEDDLYMPRPTITAENSDRGNSAYVEGMCHSSNGWDPVTAFADNIGVYTSIRGESARIIFYCMTVNAKLRLVDDANTDFDGVGGRVTMGKLSDMLKWHLTNPVNEREINRNNGGQYLQGNRNAFVDHRSYACKIWGNYNGTTKKLCDEYDGWTDAEEPTKELTKLTKSGTPTKTTYNVGDIFVPSGLTVIATYSDGSTLDVTSQVTWSVLKLGDTSAVGTYEYRGTSLTITVSGLTVINQGVPTTGVEMSTPILSLNVGQTQQLSCVVTPDDATNKNVSWSSSDEEVATVTGNGLVTALKAGQTTITVTTENGGFTASCSVTIKSNDEPQKAMVGIDVIHKPTKLSYSIGETFSTDGMLIFAIYNDGTDEDITYKATLETPSLSSEGTKVVKVSYKTFETSFNVMVLNNAVDSLIYSKSPAKLHYQIEEHLNPYGAVIKANMSDGTSIANVATLCSYEYDFRLNNKVTASFGGKTVDFYVFVDAEEPTVEHNAAEFAYSFNEKLESIDAEEVSKQQWNSMEYYYNQLNDEAKAYLKSVSASTGKGEVSAEVPNQEALKQCAKKYDETYLAHKTEGFVDFIGRDPQPTSPSNNNGLLILIGVGCGVFVLIVIIVVIAVSVSKKGKKKYAQ